MYSLKYIHVINMQSCVLPNDFIGHPVSYLEEGQAVLVLALALGSQIKVVKGPAERWRLGQLLDDFHSAGWEDPTGPADLPLQPVLVELSAEKDDVSLGEAQVARTLSSVAAQGFCSRYLQRHKAVIGLETRGAGLLFMTHVQAPPMCCV